MLDMFWGMTMRLLVNLIYDKQYKGYVADVPELPGCMSQGKTIESALKNVKEAIILYLETAPTQKHSIPKLALTTTVEV
jgi:predicted RNase H-like HicB family nuclease